MEFGLKGMSWVCRGCHGEVGIMELGLYSGVTWEKYEQNLNASIIVVVAIVVLVVVITSYYC